ncbi:MAG: hypothetical protein ACFBZ8_11070 [Opitutales bacterium]
MTVTVDSNVILDVVQPASVLTARSVLALTQLRLSGKLLVGEVVLAETATYFSQPELHLTALSALSVQLVNCSPKGLYEAGKRFRAYRRAGGPRERILPDFPVGTQAIERADALLTRDRGFYRKYCSELRVIDPNDFV